MPTEPRAPPLRLGSTAPNFQADTTLGHIDFHEWIGHDWALLYSHPEDYTPVCTTELASLAKSQPEFARRGVKVIGLSANSVESHHGWISDIDEIGGRHVAFPIIGDKDRRIAFLYDMIDHQDLSNVDDRGLPLTIRSVFIIDPRKTIRVIVSYPASTGRSTTEILRVIDSLQSTDKHRIFTPSDWTPGDDVVLPPTIKNDEAKVLFPEFRIVKPYLRYTNLSNKHASAVVA